MKPRVEVGNMARTAVSIAAKVEEVSTRNG